MSNDEINILTERISNLSTEGLEKFVQLLEAMERGDDDAVNAMMASSRLTLEEMRAVDHAE